MPSPETFHGKGGASVTNGRNHTCSCSIYRAKGRPINWATTVLSLLFSEDVIPDGSSSTSLTLFLWMITSTRSVKFEPHLSQLNRGLEFLIGIQIFARVNKVDILRTLPLSPLLRKERGGSAFGTTLPGSRCSP